jgi:hypothetical protein
MKKTYPKLPEWIFELDEVSANVYEVIGVDRLGHRVASRGLDLEQVIEQCKKYAMEIDAASFQG